MEKRRRARINNCLNELKTLILDAMKKDVSILKMTVLEKSLGGIRAKLLGEEDRMRNRRTWSCWIWNRPSSDFWLFHVSTFSNFRPFLTFDLFKLSTFSCFKHKTNNSKALSHLLKGSLVNPKCVKLKQSITHSFIMMKMTDGLGDPCSSKI